MMREARAALESLRPTHKVRDPSRLINVFSTFLDSLIFLLLFLSLEALYSELPWLPPEPSAFSLHFSSLLFNGR
ncbi:hypothetical protein CK203_007230 [Vitis vinifera]|uniref:Uncharacterized protein n=1 Tax=Vitis vinifera TaxID=29760 RepID=A0A438G154_VITVI|nr:hypothetical protein CK203_007230 [Vitis vinifera]